MSKFRKLISIFLLVFALSIVLQINYSNIFGAVPSDATSYNGHAYKVFKNEMSWLDAKKYCENLGGHLVTITSADEQNFIFNLVQKYSNDRYWIGLNDIEVNFQWKWVTGEKFSYSNWDYGEPSDSGGIEDYVLLYKSNGKWNDGYDYVGYNIGFVCEWESDNKTATPVTASYTITYNANGGSGAPANQTKKNGVTMSLSATKPTRSGYTFMGWATTASATTAAYQAGGNFTTNANITLYAVWKKTDIASNIASNIKGTNTLAPIDKIIGPGQNIPVTATYTITYNANGGSGAPGKQTKKNGVTLTLSATKPTRNGYTFMGWATSATATTAAYQAGGNFTTNANTTLYAVWKKTDAKSSYLRYGDVNGDGYINQADMDLLLAYSSNVTKNIVFEAADLDGDGQITGTDRINLMDYLAGKRSTFTVESKSFIASIKLNKNTFNGNEQITISAVTSIPSTRVEIILDGHTYSYMNNDNEAKTNWTKTTTAIVFGDGKHTLKLVAYAPNNRSVSSQTVNISISNSSKPGNVPVTSVEIMDEDSPLILKVGDEVKITAIVSPSNATNKSVTYSSTNTNIFSVSSDGTITAKKDGFASVTVTTVDGGFKASRLVQVSQPVSVTDVVLNKKELNLKIGETATLTATVLPSNASKKDIEFVTSNKGIADISASVTSVVITAKSAGTTTIQAYATDHSGAKDYCIVTVTPNTPPPVKPNPPSLSVNVNGNTCAFTWNTISNATSYDLEIHTIDGKMYGDKLWNASSGKSVQLPDGSYFARVFSVNGLLYTVSNDVYFTVGSKPNPPTLSVNVNGNTCVFTWNTVSNATSYELEIHTIDGKMYGDKLWNASSGKSVQLPDGSYFARVFSVNGSLYTVSNDFYFTVGVSGNVEGAIKWANSKLGSHNYDFYCVAFVYQAFYNGAGVKSSSYSNAKIAANKLKTHTDKNPPRGAVVFYDYWTTLNGKYDNYGHIAISLGNGRIIHAFGSKGVIETSMDIGLTYIGWGEWR